MMWKKIFKYLDGIGKMSPFEKAQIEWETTKEALLDAMTHAEDYNNMVKVLTVREKRLASYLGEHNVS